MMLSGRLGVPIAQENKLWLSWHDTAWIPILNPTNIMDYFSQKSNPFYDRTCNNENVRMQRLGLEQLNNMIGVEYSLIHVAEPILYVIRKQHRHSPTEVTPLADYYIIAGIVYQAPDLANVFNSRILSAVTHMQSALEEASSYSKYHPNKGYSWDFSSNKTLSEKTKAASKKDAGQTKEEPGSLFQRQRVDMLLGELFRKFPPPMPPQLQQQNAAQQQANANQPVKTEPSQDNQVTIKQEPNDNPASNNPTPAEASPTGNNIQDIKSEPNSDMKPPPEKKMKL